MDEPISASFLGPLLKEYYGLSLIGGPHLLNTNENQQVLKIEAAGERSLTVRLAQSARSKARILAETGVLLFIARHDFPAPRLRLTLAGEQVIEWRPGCWGYLLEYIEGNHVSIN